MDTLDWWSGHEINKICFQHLNMLNPGLDFQRASWARIKRVPDVQWPFFSSSASQSLWYHYIAYYMSSCFSTLCLVRVYLWDNCRLKGKWANIANNAWIFSESFLNYKYLDRPNDIFVNTRWDHYIGLNMVFLQPMSPCRPNHSLLQYSLLGPACVFLRKRILKMYCPKQMTIQRIQNQGENTNFAPKM